MPVLPDWRDGIGTNWHNGLKAGSGGIGLDCFKNSRIGRIAHAIVPAAAFGAWASRSQQGKRIPTGVPVIPENS